MKPQAIQIQKVSIDLLPDEIECRIDDWYYPQYTIGDIKIESKENPEEREDKTIYICDEVDMPKYNISHITDNIWEHMDENHEDWREKNWDSLDELHTAMSIVFDKWWNKVPHTVRWRHRQVILNNI